MTKLKKEELLKVLREVFETKRMDLQSLFYDIPEKEFYERKKKLNAAEGQIRELIKIFFAKEISTGPIKKDISQPNLIEWLQGINQAATAVKDYYVMKATTQLVEIILKPEVTEAWIEEKARELITMVSNLYPHEASPCVIPKGKAKDFIRSLIEDIKK